MPRIFVILKIRPVVSETEYPEDILLPTGDGTADRPPVPSPPLAGGVHTIATSTLSQGTPTLSLSNQELVRNGTS